MKKFLQYFVFEFVIIFFGSHSKTKLAGSDTLFGFSGDGSLGRSTEKID